MTVDAADSGGPLFEHGRRSPDDATNEPLQNTTRYLCAAVYLDRRICAQVISEFLDDAHRAVVPSFGFDVGPVILHALQARRYRLLRDAVLAAIWLVALALLGAVVFAYFLVWLAVAICYATPWRRISPVWRPLARWGAIGSAVVLFLVGLEFLLAWLSSGLDDFGKFQSENLSERLKTGLALGSLMLLTFGIAGTAILHIRIVNRVLVRDLAPAAIGRLPVTRSPRVRFILDRVRSAQRGNVTLYAGTNPFIGAGGLDSPWARTWSIVLELDRPAPGPLGTDPSRPGADIEPPDAEADAARAADDRPQRVDPLVMHLRVRERLHGMRDADRPDPSQPPRQGDRIARMLTAMHVVARGESSLRPHPPGMRGSGPVYGHPLIDTVPGVPFSVASPDAVEALVRHPETGIRCYQRITVGAQGQAAIGRDGRVVAPAEDQDVSVSAFVYLAVEGRMLYGHLATTVLPPVRREFRIVDRPSERSGGLRRFRPIGGEPRTVLNGVLMPWARIAAACWTMARNEVVAAFAGEPEDRPAHDFGARISVRELCAADGFDTYIQQMDVDKHTRLIERRVNEALLDYLGGECGLDVSAYRAQAGVILNEGVIMTGGTVNGQVAAGREAAQWQGGPGAPGRPESIGSDPFGGRMSEHGDRTLNISGNVYGQVASGDHVTQNQQINAAGSGQDVVDALARVERLLEAHAGDLAEPGRARRDLADVQEEAASDEPDPERMEGALGRLGRRVAGVAVLAEAVHALGTAIGVGG
ncbi:vitamin K epoxide reductase family protein [Actinomadura chokoriensis]|uniref:vitamin K epoxide reductase family protein n=1 Tax=Actinomadura chokoriensis TaxID=454156 RepID=UPI0031F963CA